MSPPHPRVAVVLLAAGSGSRIGGATNKVLLPLLGTPVLGWSVRTVAELPYVEHVVVVHRAEDRSQVAAVSAGAALVEGAGTRHGSEWKALQSLAGSIDGGAVDVVAIHDTARPLAGRELFDAVVGAAVESGGALPVRHQPGLIAAPGAPTSAGQLVTVQTPQAFRAGPLLDAYRQADRDGFEGTDTAACVDRYTDLVVRGVPGDATNVKITYPDDIALAGRLLHATRVSRRDGPAASSP